MSSVGSTTPVFQTSTTYEETIHTTANHPWLTADQGWVLAGKLQVGEPVLRADGTTAVVAGVQVVPDTGTMYDLEVSNVHTFEVGLGQWVVHNCAPFGRPLNGNGDPYPTVIDPRTGYPIPFPHNLIPTPPNMRVPWTNLERGGYITEWYNRGYGKLPQPWADYDIHHIKPREWGVLMTSGISFQY